jgi:hypothetical protein
MDRCLGCPSGGHDHFHVGLLRSTSVLTTGRTTDSVNRWYAPMRKPRHPRHGDSCAAMCRATERSTTVSTDYVLREIARERLEQITSVRARHRRSAPDPAKRVGGHPELSTCGTLSARLRALVVRP